MWWFKLAKIILMLERKSFLWRKAAIIGSIWASSEIVLGSFLHNIHLPFKGQVMTAISIIIMIVSYRLWPEKGLLWRSGLICAVMKSISPSAVIIGPMIAIFMEGFIMEFTLRILPFGNLSFLIGGGFVMLWTFVQKILTLFVFYGSDAVRVYVKVINWITDMFGVSYDVWLPILILVIIYFTLGVLVSFVSLYVNFDINREILGKMEKKSNFVYRKKSKIEGKYSLILSAFHIVFLFFIMYSIKKNPVYVNFISVSFYCLFLFYRYESVRRLYRRFGVFVSIIISAVIFGVVLNSFYAGINMAFRVISIVSVFSALSWELTNPLIKKVIKKFVSEEFIYTLEYAFSTLPLIIKMLPDAKVFFRYPFKTIIYIIKKAPELIESEVNLN